MLVVLYLVLQHLQSVEFCSRSVADSSPSLALVFGYVLCRTRRVLCLNRLYVGMIGKESVALCQRHRMRVHLSNRRPVVVGQTADAMLDVKLMLAHHSSTRIAQQLIVVQQTSGYRIFYRRHAYHGRVASHILVHLLEGGTANKLYLLAFEVLMGGDVVKRAVEALYSYSLHCIKLKNPAFTFV